MRVKINIEGYINDNHTVTEMQDALAVALDRFGNHHVEIDITMIGHTTVRYTMEELARAREGLIA